MSFNRELFKNKILYRASYRGTKEMDKLMQGFVRSIIDKLDENDLEILNEFVNMDDQLLMSIKKNIAVLGSTGSIGTQTLEIIKENKDVFNVFII